MQYRFGEIEIDSAARTLRRRGREQAVEPKVMDLLLFLLRQPASAVSRQVLLQELWPDTVVSGCSLTRLVKEARRAVGDDGRHQRVIRTLHGRGYRFVAPVVAKSEDDERQEELAIRRARRSLEDSLAAGGCDLRRCVREFADACLLAIESARARAGAAGGGRRPRARRKERGVALRRGGGSPAGSFPTQLRLSSGPSGA